MHCGYIQVVALCFGTEVEISFAFYAKKMSLNINKFHIDLVFIIIIYLFANRILVQEQKIGYCRVSYL